MQNHKLLLSKEFGFGSNTEDIDGQMVMCSEIIWNELYEGYRTFSVLVQGFLS
jgi:hypothetical protein